MASLALGGLATARRGITTQEGEDMANNKVQLDRRRADTNKDGQISKYEELAGEATQKAMLDDPEQDDKFSMAHGGLGMDYMASGIMGYDDVSGNPIPLGASAENVRDDIDANISTDEYVLPAHVVKWHGLKHIQELQSEAEMGLMTMKMDGLIQEVQGETETESDSEGVEDAKVSDESGAEQEEEETIQTPEGNEIEVAGVKTTLVEPEIDETEEYKNNKSGKSTQMFGTMQKPRVSFIM